MNAVEKQRKQPEDKAPSEDRLTMLCDGIFAIAITLLVLDIKIPPLPALPANDPTVLKDVQDNMAEIISRIGIYLITFIIIAAYWIQHRRLTEYIKRLDTRFIWLTFLFLTFVVFFPVAFNVAVEYGGYPEGVIFYTLELAGCGFSYQALWLYASWKRRLIDSNVRRDEVAARSIRGLIGPVYFCLSLLLLFIPFFRENPFYVFYTWMLVTVFYFIYRRIQGPSTSASEVREQESGTVLEKEAAPKDALL